MKNLLLKIKNWYTKLPDKKRHFELISAILTIPMMLTVILVNFNNIESQKQKTNNIDTTKPIQIIITGANSSYPSPTSIPTPTPTLIPTPTIKSTPTATPSATITP